MQYQDRKATRFRCTIFNVFEIGSSLTLDRTLKIYGASDMRDRLEPLLIWATPGQRGFPSRKAGSSVLQDLGQPMSYASEAGPSTQRRGVGQNFAPQEAARKQQEALQKAAELRQMLSTLEKVDDEGRRSSLLDTLCSTNDMLDLPLHPNPPGIQNGDLKVDLLKHQVKVIRIHLDRRLMSFLRVKHYNGVLNANTPFFPRERPINQSNSGN